MHSGAHVPCTRPERPPLPSYQRAPGRVAERLRCEVVPGRRWRSHAMRRCLWLRQSETNACALIVRSLVCKTQSEAVGARRVNTDCDSCCAGVTYHLPTCRSAMRYERSPPAISTVADTRTLARMIQASKTGFSAPSCATTVRCLSPTLRISVSYIAILDRCRRTYALCTQLPCLASDASLLSHIEPHPSLSHSAAPIPHPRINNIPCLLASRFYDSEGGGIDQ